MQTLLNIKNGQRSTVNGEWLTVNGKRLTLKGFFTLVSSHFSTLVSFHFSTLLPFHFSTLLPFTLYLLPFTLLTLVSCTEEIDIKLKPSDTRLVVEGGIGIDVGVHTVILSTTMDYFNTNAPVPYVSDAMVTITELDKTMAETGEIFILTENPEKKGHYETEPTVFGKQGYTYRLNISNVNVGKSETYTADAYFPYIADKIDTVLAVYGIDMLLGDLIGGLIDTSKLTKGWNILLFAQDPPTQEYYIFLPYKNGVPLNDTLTDFFMISDEIIPAGLGIRGLPIEFISDSSWAVAKEGDTLGLEIRSISEDYYRYINEFNSVHSGSNPMFGGAPANVRGNVSGGAIGYFHAYGNRKAFTICDKATKWPPSLQMLSPKRTGFR